MWRTLLAALLSIHPGHAAAFAGPTPDMVDVSHGWGIPFGGIGTGYSMFGKYGFVRVNFNHAPDHFEYSRDPASREDYTREPAAPRKADFGFVLREGGSAALFAEKPAPWLPSAQPFDRISSYAYLPKGFFTFEKPQLQLNITLAAFSPMAPHDLANSTIPVQVFDFTIGNPTDRQRTIELSLQNPQQVKPSGNKAVLEDPDGHLAFGAVDGVPDAHGVHVQLVLRPGQSRTARFFIAWYYPAFQTPSPAARGDYQRYYTAAFPNAAAVIDRAVKSADDWSRKIDQWHDSIDVPPPFKRLWFSSLASVMASSLMSAAGDFFEIETPHQWVNTMDVLAYSNWVYLINWPELERADMDQYFKSMPVEGQNAGFVWHSLFSDSADYAEEPTFLVRVWRDYLWFNDAAWLKTGFPHALRAANRTNRVDGYEDLIASKHGNQSYDLWKMPGVSAYVNIAWLYGLYALEGMSSKLGEPALIDGIAVRAKRADAATSLDTLLWNDRGHYWNLFARTPGADQGNVPESALTDQLFGKWMVLLDPHAADVLPEDKVKLALETLYKNNLIEDPAAGFRGWVNGMLPGPKPDTHSGPHAKTAWIGAQLDLGSLLGAAGDERASLDVFRSVESSLHNNHLAVGEWNRSIDDNGKAVTLREEPGKDTPRFPPYPRYKCSWEYLVRILGLQADDRYVYLQPFQTIDFGLNGVELAGMKLTVKVTAGWTGAAVDGKKVTGPVRLDRAAAVKQHRVEFR